MYYFPKKRSIINTTMRRSSFLVLDLTGMISGVVCYQVGGATEHRILRISSYCCEFTTWPGCVQKKSKQHQVVALDDILK